MADINKCNPCLPETNPSCCDRQYFICDESQSVAAIQSSNSFKIFLSLGISKLFPGLVCNTEKCKIDLRDPQSLEKFLLRISIDCKDENQNPLTIKGWTIPTRVLGQEQKPIVDKLSFPLEISLLDIHNKYLKPLVAAIQEPPVEPENLDPKILKLFDPSCLLNSAWYEKKQIASIAKYQIKQLFLNDTNYCVPKSLQKEVENYKTVIKREINQGIYILPNPKSLVDENNSPKTYNKVSNIKADKLFETEIHYWHDIGFNMDQVKEPDFNLLTATAEQKTLRDVYLKDRVRFDRWRKDIGVLLQFYDNSFTGLFIKNPNIKALLEAGCLNKDLVEVAKVGSEEQRREFIRSLFNETSLYKLGTLCINNNITSKQVEKLFECLGKENILDNKGNPTGRFKFNNLKVDIVKNNQNIKQMVDVGSCYKDLNINVYGSCDNGPTINIVIGEDACDSAGELPLRKTNYAVLKRPLEFIFTNNNNCEPSNLINSCKANCCITYDDSKKLLDATGINDEDFQNGLVYSKLDKEDDKFIGYTVYKCKTCDEITETEINSFCEFETQGFCCSEGYWEQVNGLEKLKKPVTAGVTDIFTCCQVAKNEFNKNSHFIFSTFKNSATNTDNRIIVDENRSGLQLLKSDLENNCLPKTKCCIAKREGGACFYRKPRSSDRRLEYDISFEVNLLSLSEDHEGHCEKLEKKDLGDRRKKSNGVWDSVVAFNDDLTPNFKGIISPNSSNDFFSDVLPGCDPFDTLKVRLSQSKSLPQDKQAIEFIRILLELKKLNRWVFNRDDQKNQKIIDIWDKELKDNLKINVVDIASNDDNKIKSIINSITYGNLKPYNKLYIKQFSTQSEFDDDDQWIPYNFNGQQYSCNAYRSCLDFLKLEKKIFVYSDTVNYCNLLDNGSLTNDMDRLVAYLIDSSGTRFKSIISGALNKYAIENKIEFVPGKCTNTATLYGCISSSAITRSTEECCPEDPSDSSPSASHGSYFALGGNKTLLDDPPHPVGTYSDGNNPYDPNLITQLKAAIVNDMFDDFNAHNGDGSGIYKIKLNIKNVNPCLEYDIEGTFKDYEGNIIDSELKCKNHAQHILECCDTIEISGGTCECATTPQTFDDYVYIPGLAALSQATVQLKTASCNMTADIKDTSSGNRVFIFSTNNPNPVLTNFGDKEILVVISAEYGDIPKLYNIPQKTPLTEQKFRIKANELLTGLTTNNDKFSARLKNIIFKYLNNLKTNNPKLPDPTDGMLTRTVWKLYLRSNEIEVQNCPTDGCLELSAVQYTQKGKDKWVPSEYICIDNIPYPPHIDGIDARYRIPGTKYYNGRVVTDCNACDDNPVSSPPPQNPATPINPSDPDNVPSGCEEIKKAVDAKKSQIISILMQLKDKLLTYNQHVLAWNNNNCSITKPTKQCNDYKQIIESNYIDANKSLLNRLNQQDINPGRQIITESPLPFKISKLSTATLNQKTRYTKLLKELETLENALKNCN